MAQRLTPMLLCQHRPIVRPPRSGIVPMADRRGRTRQPNNSTLPPKKRRLCNEAMQISCSCGLLCVRNRWHKVTFLMLGNQRRVKSAPSSRATHPERAAHHSPSLSSRSPPHSPFVLNFSTRTQCPKRESKFGGGVTVPSFTPFSSFDRFCPFVRPTLISPSLSNEVKNLVQPSRAGVVFQKYHASRPVALTLPLL
jgi:hypothetical protein